MLYLFAYSIGGLLSAAFVRRTCARPLPWRVHLAAFLLWPLVWLMTVVAFTRGAMRGLRENRAMQRRREEARRHAPR